MSNQALTKTNGQSTLKQILSGDAFKIAVAKALPKHLPPDRFLRVAQTAMTRTPKLAECDQASFLGALLTLSALGLEPDGRRAHLIPFENRKRNVTECQLIVDYKGVVELAMRSGTVASIHADKVCEEDVFEVDRGSITKHVIDYKKPRGNAYAFYCLIRFKDGGEKSEVMTRQEVDAVRARSRAGQSGPWCTDYDEMAKKTVFKRASKWITLSPEIMDAIEGDADTPIDQPINIISTVNAPAGFALPEPSPEAEDNVDLTPPTRETVPPQTEGEQAPSIKEQLAIIVNSAGYSFDNFLQWGRESGNLSPAELDTVSSFEELSQDKAKFCVKNKAGLLKQLAAMKAVAK